MNFITKRIGNVIHAFNMNNVLAGQSLPCICFFVLFSPAQSYYISGMYSQVCSLPVGVVSLGSNYNMLLARHEVRLYLLTLFEEISRSEQTKS